MKKKEYLVLTISCVWLDKGKVRMIGEADEVCAAYEYFMSDEYRNAHHDA